VALGRSVAEKAPRTGNKIIDRAHALDFRISIAYAVWVCVSAMGALALRAYQAFGIGNTALLAVGISLLGIWGVPKLYQIIRSRPQSSSTFFPKLIAAITAGLLVLFVRAANVLPDIFGNEVTTVSPNQSAPSSVPGQPLAVGIAPAPMVVISQPLYLRAINLRNWNRERDEPLSMSAVPDITATKLRVFVDYDYGSDIERVKIGDIDVVRHESFELPLVHAEGSRWETMWWGEDKRNYVLFDSTVPASLERIRIVILGRDNREQYYPAVIQVFSELTRRQRIQIIDIRDATRAWPGQ
jgi:hypothetical protein